MPSSHGEDGIVQPVRRLVRSSSRRAVSDAQDGGSGTSPSPRRLRLLGHSSSSSTLGGGHARGRADSLEQSSTSPAAVAELSSLMAAASLPSTPYASTSTSALPQQYAVPSSYATAPPTPSGTHEVLSTPKKGAGGASYSGQTPEGTPLGGISRITYTPPSTTTTPVGKQRGVASDIGQSPAGYSVSTSSSSGSRQARALPVPPSSPPPPLVHASSSSLSTPASSSSSRLSRSRKDHTALSSSISEKKSSSTLTRSSSTPAGTPSSTASTSHASSGKATTSSSTAGTTHSTPSSSRDVKLPTLASATLDSSALTGPALSLSTPYWSIAPIWGRVPNRAMRAHTATLVEPPSPPPTTLRSPGFPNFSMGLGSGGASLWIFGGCDNKTCFRDMWKLDLASHQFSKPKIRGSVHPPALRAHSCTYIPPFLSGKTSPTTLQGHLLVFGGGDGPEYFNDTYLLNLTTLTWSKPPVFGEIPSKRRAHTAVWYERNKWLVVFGGGNGSKALNDVYVLECARWDKLNWRRLDIAGTKPGVRGYHTMNLISDGRAVVFGGSDGKECFANVFILDLHALTWTEIPQYSPSLHVPRLSHSATLLSPSHLLILGGHDGTAYQSSLIVLDLITGAFSSKPAGGNIPCGRGYHTATYYDGRVYLIGGYDGKTHWEETWVLDLAAWPEVVLA